VHDDEQEEEREFLRYQRTAGDLAIKSTASKVKAVDKFVKVPLWWAEQAARATGTPKAFVWVWLLHLSWKAKSNTFPLPNGQLRDRGVNRLTKHRALRELEVAGLIQVTRKTGKTPVVTLLHI
jgi:hypothetical protein